MRDCVLIIHIL